MKSKFLKLLHNIKTYSSYYFTIISVLGVIWGAFALYDKWRDNNRILRLNVETIIKAQIQSAKTDSILISNQKKIEQRLDDLEITTESIEKSYINYITRDKTLTKEDFLKYMEGLNFNTKKTH